LLTATFIKGRKYFKDGQTSSSLMLQWSPGII